MTLRRNQSVPRFSASVLTTVGLMRVSTGPPARIRRQRHGGIAFRLHQRGGGEHRHGGLAHREHVHVAAEEAEHVDHRVDVVVEIERAGRQRHVARILPVGDVDLVIGQERLDGAAQQRGEMARHRRHQQQARVARGAGGSMSRLKCTRRQNGVCQHHLLGHAHRCGHRPGAGDAELGLGVAPGRALEHLAGGDGAAADRRVRRAD